MFVDVEDVVTMTQIAEECALPLHRVRYVIESRYVIPIKKIGGVNLYSKAAAQFVKQVCSEISLYGMSETRQMMPWQSNAAAIAESATP